MTPPLVTVVMPTHNRAGRLRLALDSLSQQDWPPQQIEAIVVADGCTDGTAEAFAGWQPPFRARLVQQPPLGAAAARNRGAAEARGRYLIFLDDDVRAEPGLIRAHLTGHDRPGRVVIGYLPAVIAGRDFFSVALRGWWDAMFQAMWKPGHRFTFRDLLSGNFSIEKALFDAVGGFQHRLRCHEDYELGLRLIDAGAEMDFAPDAVGLHDERTDLRRALVRKFEEGRADVWLSAAMPGLIDALPLRYMRGGTARRRLLRWLARRWTVGGDALASILLRRLRLYEWLRLRYRWNALLDDLFYHAYWRGVAAARGASPPPGLLEPARHVTAGAVPLDVDLADGLESAEALLDRERPAAATLLFGDRLIGEVPAMPGAERLRGLHLRPLLAGLFIEPYLCALALAGELPPVVDPARVLAACAPPLEPRAMPDGPARARPSRAAGALPAGAAVAQGSTAPDP